MSNFAPAVDNAVKIFEVISQSPAPIGVSEISRRLDINKNMVFRILNSLEAAGWIFSDNTADKKYQLTLLPFKLSSGAVDRLSLSNVAAPYVYELWQKTGESTYLGIPSGDKVLYIQHLDGTGDVKIAGVVGGAYDMNCSAPGKVLLSYSSDEFINEYVNKGFQKRTQNTLTKAEELLNEIKRIKQNGYAVDNEEFGKGIICLAAPIFDFNGKVLGSIGCTSSTVENNFDEFFSKFYPLVTEAANKISCCFGFKEAR